MKELLVVLVGQGCQSRNQPPPCCRQRNRLEAAVIAAFSAGDQLLAHQPIHQFGDAAARHPNPLRQNAWRGLLVVEHLPHHHPLGHGHPAGQELAGKGVRDVIGDEAEPESNVLFQVADGQGRCLGVLHGK